jgi:hypothetical protein
LKLALSALLLACTPACFAQVHATITMRDPSALEVSYQIPPSCTGLAFANDGMRPQTVTELRRDWRAADDCTVFDANGIKPARASCTTLRVRVPASTRVLDRIYPWASPLGDGLYLHTDDYALTPACGPVEWTFGAPGGTVVVDGVEGADSATRTPAQVGDGIPVVLLKQAFQPGAPRVHADPRFGPQTVARVVGDALAVERQLKRDLPGVDFTMPYIAAGVAPRGNYQADMAHRTIMRLSFPAEPGPAQDEILLFTLPHEMAHMTQPVNWNDSWAGEPLVHEGGAELLRVTVATHLGWYDQARMQAQLEHAVNACVLAAEGKNWKGIRNRGWGKVPYDCGLAFYLVALSANPGPAPPLLRVRDYYRQAHTGQRTDFAQALECGARAGCQPRWLTRLAGDEPLDSVLLDAARQPGALLQIATRWSQETVATLAYRHMDQLMRADCGGAVSMYQEPAEVRIAAGPHCATLRENMVVVAAQGLPLFGGDGAALKASVRACQDSGKTVLGLKDGSSVTLACGKSVDLPARLFAVDVERAQALLRTPLTSTAPN